MKLVKDLRGHMHVKEKHPKKKIKLFLTMAMALIFSLSFSTLAFAEEITPVPLDLTGVTSAITGSLSVTQITVIIAAVVGAGMAFVIYWFGARKVLHGIQNAFKKGKISV